MNKITLFVILVTTLLAGCDSRDSRSLSGSSAASTGRAASDGEQTLDASSCVSLQVDSQTVENGIPVLETHNFRISNNCRFSINVRLYSSGHINAQTDTLAPGGQAISAFLVSAGQPRGFACQVPQQPRISSSQGMDRQCG